MYTYIYSTSACNMNYMYATYTYDYYLVNTHGDYWEIWEEKYISIL